MCVIYVYLYKGALFQVLQRILPGLRVERYTNFYSTFSLVPIPDTSKAEELTKESILRPDQVRR